MAAMSGRLRNRVSRDHAENPGGPYATVWYQWTAANNRIMGRWNLTRKGGSFDTEIAVYDATGTNTAAVTNLTLVAQNEDVNFPSNLTSKVTFTVTAGTNVLHCGGRLRRTCRERDFELAAVE